MNTIATLISTALLSTHVVVASGTALAASPKDFNVPTEVTRLRKLAPQLNQKTLSYALTAFKNAKQTGQVKKDVLTVIDYSLPSSKQRMWVFDLNHEKLLYKTYVAHGRNSGNVKPTHFSNKISSKESSLGTFITKYTYTGSKGYSLRLQGLEKGFNDNAFKRAVVMHGAWYVEPKFIKQAGHAGRSWGCPSLGHSITKPIINSIKEGSVIFAYYPDKNYLSHSEFVTV